MSDGSRGESRVNGKMIGVVELTRSRPTMRNVKVEAKSLHRTRMMLVLRSNKKSAEDV